MRSGWSIRAYFRSSETGMRRQANGHVRCCSAATLSVAAPRCGDEQPQDDFCDSISERLYLLKLFILLVPGGGVEPRVEPPRTCDRRILSLFFGILQRVAIGRKLSHKAFIINRVLLNYFLQTVAAKCTKVGNEQPSKQPLNWLARGAASVAFAVPWPTWLCCRCSRYVLCSRKREHL
jgi:hypothetical protein